MLFLQVVYVDRVDGIELVLGRVGAVGLRHTRVKGATQQGGQTGVLKLFLVGPLPAVVKVDREARLLAALFIDSAPRGGIGVFRLIVGGTEDTNKREYLYVRYDDDDEEMDIYDIIELCLKGLSVLKRYIALLLVFLVVGCMAGFCKHKFTTTETCSSSALLFVDLNREELTSSDNAEEASRINMLANSLPDYVE